MDVKTKITIFRVLKVISYCAGLPLMALLVWKDSLILFNSDVYKDTALNGLYIAFAVWAFVTLAQIGISFLLKGNQKRDVRLISFIAAALIATIVPALIIDTVYNSKLENIAAEQEQYDVDVEAYNKLAAWYKPLTEDKDIYAELLSEDVDDFCRIYNIKYLGKNKGKNIDGAEVIEDEVNYVYTKPNGMYSDGYIFGLKQALDILIDYNEVKESKGGYAAVEADYSAALARAYASPEWIAYSSTPEFIANQTDALKYYVETNKINVILSVLGSKLINIPFMSGKLLDLVLPIVEGIKPEGSEFTIKEILAALPEPISLTATIGGQTVANPEFFNNLSIGTLMPILGALGISLTEDDIMGLLSGYSFYWSSNNYPIWNYFLAEDADLARYGLAKYYATQHGALCDSVLINEAEDGKIGKSSDLDGDGYPASFGFTLEELYQLRADLSYKIELYPILTVRHYLYIFSGIIAIGFVLSSIFSAKQKKLEEEI